MLIIKEYLLSKFNIQSIFQKFISSSWYDIKHIIIIIFKIIIYFIEVVSSMLIFETTQIYLFLFN
jgi:hypothetical protein